MMLDLIIIYRPKRGQFLYRGTELFFILQVGTFLCHKKNLQLQQGRNESGFKFINFKTIDISSTFRHIKSKSETPDFPRNFGSPFA
jgi:hypothetical protein